MIRSHRTRVRSTACLCILVLAAPAHAGGLLQNIYDMAQTATNRATTARDRAAVARDNAIAARDSADEIRDNVRNGVIMLTGQMRDLITEMVDDIQDRIDEEMAGRDAFIADGGCSVAVCEPFRQDLIALMQNLEDIGNAMVAMTELDGLTLDFSREISVVQAAPGRLLFPLYRAASATGMLDGGLVDQLGDAAASLLILQEILEEPADDMRGGGEPLSTDPILAAELESCRSVLAEPLSGEFGPNGPIRSRAAMRTVITVAHGLKVTGTVMKAFGERAKDDFEIQIHGYVGIKFTKSPIKKWGGVLAGIGNVLGPVTAAAHTKIRHCVMIYEHDQVLRAVESVPDCPSEGSADLNGDGDVNLLDYALFQQQFGG